MEVIGDERDSSGNDSGVKPGDEQTESQGGEGKEELDTAWVFGLGLELNVGRRLPTFSFPPSVVSSRRSMGIALGSFATSALTCA